MIDPVDQEVTRIASMDKAWLGPAVVHLEGGRIAWPSIFRYEHRAEYGPELHDLPPVDETVYRYVVTNVDAFEVLVSRGCLRDPRHTGRVRPVVVDNRKAPGVA